MGWRANPGLVPGFVGGFIAGMPQIVDGKTASAGFLGAIVIGMAAGHVTNLLKKLKVPVMFRPIMPIIVIPILSAVPVGLLMLTLNMPIASIMVNMMSFLSGLQSGSQIVLAMVLGAMIAFDMGGPVNKAAFFFGAAMIQQGNYAVMGACAAAICTPPIGLGLATLLSRKNWTGEQRESGLAALGMGMVGVTEGAIPFAAGDPLRVIPTIMLGSMVSAVIAMLGGVGDHAPHGGPIVLPVVDHRFIYVVAIIAGSLVTAVTINLIKKYTEFNQPRSKQSMKFVAVTACPTGIAHTYMAAAQLEKTAKKLGHTIKVETQGAMGIENELTQAEVDAADAAILATDIAIEQAERFSRARKIQVPVQAALRIRRRFSHN